MIEEKNNYEDYMEVFWTLKIFCIHSDYLFPYSSDKDDYYNYNYNENDTHYFSNCDCYERVRKKYNSHICYYNQLL